MSSSEASAQAGALPAGSLVANTYRVEGVLGTGGMGMVYRARHVDTGDVVALKVLHAHLVQNHQVSERFQREASILRRLRGRHLVSLLDFGQDEGGQLFMALELVDGQPLESLIQERAPLPPDEAAQLIGGICDALASAHAHGVVHRDLTPANVMVERDELGRPHVRVFDFGLAKALHDASSSSVALTHHNMIFGTAEYMSPEQVRGEELDGRSDVYAAGAILYELLTGAPPFRGHNDVLTMTAHITETPEVPSRRLGRRGVISPALDAVILRALTKNRDERFPSAHALRDALFLALRAERPSALPPASVDPSSQTMAAPMPVPGANSSHQPASSAPPNRLPSSNVPPSRLPVPSAPPGRLPIPSAPPARLPLPSSPPVARLPMPSAPPARQPMGSASLMQQPSFSASAGPQAHYTPHAAHPTSSAPHSPNYQAHNHQASSHQAHNHQASSHQARNHQASSHQAPSHQAHNHQAHGNASAGRPMPPTPTSGHSSDTMLAAPPVVVAPPPSQGTVDPFTTTMTLQGPPSALNGPFSVNPALQAAPSKPGPISPDSFAAGKGFRPMVWVTVAVFAVLLGVALGVGLSLYH